MRVNCIYLLALGVSVSCLPHSSFPEESTKLQLQRRGEVKVKDSNPHGMLKGSAIAGLSLAGLIAASVGATEYISSVYHRFSKGKIESQNDIGDNKFSRDRMLADEEFQNDGIDMVLNLIEKHAHEREEPVETEDPRVNESEREEDSKPEAVTAPTTAAEESVDIVLPLPRLPGHPPLSSLTEDASDKAEFDSAGESEDFEDDEKDIMNGVRGCSFHPICDKLRESQHNR